MSPLGTSRLHRNRAIDRAAAVAITVGGSSVLLAVAFLMVFLFAQCLPLLRAGAATPVGPTQGIAAIPLAAFEDEYRERVFVLAADGRVHLVGPGASPGTQPLAGVVPPVRQARVSSSGTLLAIEDGAGTLQLWVFRAQVEWRGAQRVIRPEFTHVSATPLPPGGRLLAVSGPAQAPAVLVGTARGALLITVGDPPRTTVLAADAVPIAGALAADASQVWLASARELAFFAPENDAPTVSPIATVPLRAPATVASLVLGDVTCLVGEEDGEVEAWQVLTGTVAGSRVLDLAGTFRGSGGVRALAPSERDKTFLIGRTGGAEVAHLTSRRVVARIPGWPVDAAVTGLSPRCNGVFAVTPAGAVHRWALELPSPEVTFATLFLPVRYEGYRDAELAWQSTGGSESFEPKLSLIPLLVGTLKGALYALLFSAPVALAAALYVSQFAPAWLRQFAKPTIELMAALPSVVVGFLAALLFAPWLQRHVVGMLAALIAMPIAIIVGAAVWQMTPRAWRQRTSAARELTVVGLLAATAFALAFATERVVETGWFAGDFKQWLITTAGVTYDQRNALVVGFALGFAVIPIIFTLAEDAFSNVPPSLISASLALGATRWQAARTVAIPAASPGLFAAIMTGFGRAVGETMIVLMATGNTPIMSMSPFNAMRTMSAGIAVELPEAPYGGTLYRVLILTALLLFGMTFVINTAAVLVSARLRRRFGRLAA